MGVWDGGAGGSGGFGDLGGFWGSGLLVGGDAAVLGVVGRGTQKVGGCACVSKFSEWTLGSCPSHRSPFKPPPP